MTATNGPFARSLASWIPRANSSFPVPDSPVSSTVDGVRAAWRALRKAPAMAGPRDKIAANPLSEPLVGKPEDLAATGCGGRKRWGSLMVMMVWHQVPPGASTGAARAMSRGLVWQAMVTASV